jgi:betaine reductase
MELRRLKVVHYLNQFFARIGGEEKANIEPRVIEAPTGPGRAIQNALGDRGEVIATIVCGDNYFSENVENAVDEIIPLVSRYQPDVMMAGPAFLDGRYGVACGAICRAVKERLNLPVITGMHPENPGVNLFHRDVYIIQTGRSVTTMNEAISKMVRLVVKIAEGEEIGGPAHEGYIPRGIVINEMTGQTGAERVFEMLLAKIQGRSYESEVLQPKHDRVVPASPVRLMERASVALVTDGGLVPKGNPDGIESLGATRFGKYSLQGEIALKEDAFDVCHAGYDSTFVKQDPNRLVPVDVMQTLEREKKIGKLYHNFFSTTGVGTTVENARRIGHAIASELRTEGISGVILTST